VIHRQKFWEIDRMPIKLTKHNIFKIFNDAFNNKDIDLYKIYTESNIGYMSFMLIIDRLIFFFI